VSRYCWAVNLVFSVAVPSDVEYLPMASLASGSWLRRMWKVHTCPTMPQTSGWNAMLSMAVFDSATLSTIPCRFVANVSRSSGFTSKPAAMSALSR
jgi:hypothetical protein